MSPNVAGEKQLLHVSETDNVVIPPNYLNSRKAEVTIIHISASANTKNFKKEFKLVHRQERQTLFKSSHVSIEYAVKLVCEPGDQMKSYEISSKRLSSSNSKLEYLTTGVEARGLPSDSL
jgi:hypothetical protein